MRKGRMYRRNSTIEEAPLQNEVMLYDPSSAQFFVLNSTMAFVWRHCDGASMDDILHAMGDEFEGADDAILQNDLAEALSSLQKLGLVSEAGPSI